MPLNIINETELQGLYTKKFNPFNDIENNLEPETQRKIQSLTNECKYYSLDTSSNGINMSYSDKLSIIHLNTRSILNNEKFEAFTTFLHLTEIQWDIICISETWLNQDMEKTRTITGYSAFFGNRIGKIGGGAAIYIRDECVRSCTRLQMDVLENTESVFIRCELSCSKVFVIGQIYRPPDVCPSAFIEYMETILESLAKQRTVYPCIIAGDFNVDLFDIDTNDSTRDFFNLLTSFGFLPSIYMTTRQGDKKWSLLDNIYYNNIEEADSSGIIYDDLSDHFPIYISLKLVAKKIPNRRKQIKCFDYRRISDLQSYLQTELHGFTNVTDPNTACEMLLQAYTKGINRYSITYIPSRKNTPLKPWISPGILASINHKNALFMQRNKHPTRSNTATYNRYRNMLNNIIREAKRLYVQSELKDANMKKTWSILKEVTKGSCEKPELPKIFHTDDGNCDEPQEIADGFNSFFTSIGKQLKNKMHTSDVDPSSYLPTYTGDNMSTLSPTNEEEIIYIVKNMNLVGGGHDNLNVKLFRSTYTSIITEILHFLNVCLKESTFPRLLKLAVVKPIFKTGSKQHFNNYRPISLLPVMSKLLEKIIYNRLNDHLITNEIINNKQFGFRKGMGTYMPILLIQEKITNAFENNHILCGLYLDIRKAFDTVNIDILLNKIKRYGITNKAYDMISSYLKERTQSVQIGQTRSKTLEIEMGVPQGSILGPLLFILYINDFPHISKEITAYLYADDTAVFIEGTNESSLQNTVDIVMPKISEWFTANQLSINTDKTCYQIYSKRKDKKEIKLSIQSVEIKRTDIVKYLGMFIDENMKWNMHINKLYTVLCRNVGIITKVKYFLSTNHLLLLYNALFASYVNYCCFIYSNSYSSTLSKIQKLQKRLIRIVDGQPKLAHTDPIFKKLKLLKIKDIGAQQMILILHRKICNNLPEEVSQLFQINSSNRSRTSRNVKHFEESFTFKKYKTHTLSWTGPRVWNQIIAPLFSEIQNVPLSKHIIKKISKEYLTSQY